MLAAVVPASARTPTAGQGQRSIESPNRLFVGLPDQALTKMTVYRRTGPKTEELWSLAEWPTRGFLSDDGNYLVVGSPRGSILPRDYQPTFPLLRFFKTGKPIKTVTLSEVMRNDELTILGSSGYQWGDYEGFTAPYLFAITTANHRRLVYDVSNGLLVQTTSTSETFILDDADDSRSNGRPRVRPKQKGPSGSPR
jgi:hypothetical protein